MYQNQVIVDVPTWLRLGNFPPGMSKHAEERAKNPVKMKEEILLKGRLILIRTGKDTKEVAGVVGQIVGDLIFHVDRGIFFQAFRVRSVMAAFDLPENEDGMTERDELVDADLLVIAALAGLDDKEMEQVSRLIAMRALGKARITVVLTPFEDNETNKLLATGIEAHEERVMTT